MQASAKSIAPMQSASGRNVADRAAVVRCWPFKPDDDGKPLQLRPEPMTVAFSACNVQHQFHAVATTIHILGRTGQAERVLAALVLPGDIHPDLLTLRVSPGVHRPPPPELRKRRQRPRQALLHAIRILSDVEAVHVITQAAAPTIAWNNRGVGLPTQDVVVCSLPMDLQMLILRCLRDRLVPHIQALYPQHSAVLEQRPMPRPSNLFIVRYSASGQRGLKLHEDETALTFNVCLSTRMDFTGGVLTMCCRASITVSFACPALLARLTLVPRRLGAAFTEHSRSPVHLLYAR
jgi:hypothetical protein